MILHSKYLSQPVFFFLNNILHVHSAVSHWYVQSLASLEKYVSSGIFFSGIIFFLIIKVGHTKIFFSVALTQRPVNEVLWEFFFFFQPQSICKMQQSSGRQLLQSVLKRYINQWCHFAKKRKKQKTNCSFRNSCLIGVWCCCMCYAVQKWAFPCRQCDCHVKSHATYWWEVVPLHSGSRHMPWCRCGSGCGCCAGGTGNRG